MSTDQELDALTDALIASSRALVAVAAQSLSAVNEDVTLVQYRALVVLARQREHSSAQLAEALDVSPSSAKRLVDRLMRRGLVVRTTAIDSKREVTISLTGDGRSIVERVMRKRRKAIERIASQMPEARRRQAIAALSMFAEAAGESVDDSGSLRWLIETAPSRSR